MTTIRCKTLAKCTVELAYVSENISAYLDNRRYRRSDHNSSYSEALKVLIHLSHPEGSNSPGDVRYFRFGTSKKRIFIVDPNAGSIETSKDDVVIRDAQLTQQLKTYYSEAHKKQCIEVLRECIQEYRNELSADGKLKNPNAQKDIIKLIQMASNPKLGLIDPKTAKELIRDLKKKKGDPKATLEALTKLEEILDERHHECATKAVRQYAYVQQGLQRSSAVVTTKDPIQVRYSPAAIPPGAFLPKADVPKPEAKERVRFDDTPENSPGRELRNGTHRDSTYTKETEILFDYDAAQLRKKVAEKEAAHERESEEDLEKSRVRRLLHFHPDVPEGMVEYSRDFVHASDTDIDAYLERLAAVLHPREHGEKLRAQEIPYPRKPQI